MTIQVGQFIRHNANCRRGIVTAIYGEQSPETCQRGPGIVAGGAASFDIVWFDGSKSHRVPEAIVRGGLPWQVLDEVASPEEVSERVAASAIMQANKAAAMEERKRRHAEEVERLKTDQAFAHLQQGGDIYSGKLAAANIRKELKLAFPGMKFSVKKSTYGSVYIRWQDGPTSQEVEAVIGKYEGGHFDGMQDLYVYQNKPWNDVFGGCKYLMCSRERSQEEAA